MASKFGGIPVEEEQPKSKFGGVPVAAPSVPGMEKLGGSAPGIPKTPTGMAPVGNEPNVTDGGGGGNGPQIPAIVNQGLHQLVRAVPSFSNSIKRGFSDLIEGGAKTAAPLAIPAAIAAPAVTLSGAVVGAGAQTGGEKLTTALGGSPDTARLVGDVAGAAGGMSTSPFRGIPMSRGFGAAVDGLKAAVLEAPLIGKPLRAGIDAMRHSFADAGGFTPRPAMRPIEDRTPIWQDNQPAPAPPPLVAQRPAGGGLPSGRVPGTGEPNRAPQPAPFARSPIWDRGQVASNQEPFMPPQRPPAPVLPSGRVPGTGEPRTPPPTPPSTRIPIWQNNQPQISVPEFTPQRPIAPQEPRPIQQQAAPINQPPGRGALAQQLRNEMQRSGTLPAEVPPAAPHDFAAAPRAAKAAELGRALHEGGISSEDARLMDQGDWHMLSKGIGSRIPSVDTINAALAHLQQLEGHQ